ncbi:MAG: hypothetical protein GWO87_03345 [Xanthomonadaceae bacterium]|nr:hypothetical protein [Rhodospirillaceae bacterium]NIA18196.1 hypothetical protein [Xanthomonadaceae bacterium]
MERQINVGLMVCGSNASNTGALTAIAPLRIIKKHKNVGILSLPSLVNKVPRQTLLMKKLKKIIVVDGCQNEYAKKILENLGIKYDVYINLLYDLSIKKRGPFTTLKYSENEIDLIVKKIEKEL